jgi:RNA polymerase sigma-70 factor, ECF subfamily
MPSSGSQFEDLYAEYASRLRGYALSLTRDADQADDLVQETFIRASGHMELLAQLNGYQRRAWLNRVCKNLFLDEMRTLRRREALVNRLGQSLECAAPPAAGTLTQAALDLVPERYRDVLEQHYVMGMTSEQIAGELGIPAATVRSRLHLAIKWLRSQRSRLQ